jgi:HSP20 family protein
MASMIRWSPMNELASLHDSMDRLFSQFWGTPPSTTAAAAAVPLNVWQEKDAIMVSASIPGFKPDEVEVTVDSNGVLTLKGEHKGEQERQESDYLLREQSYSSFSRRLALPIPVKGGEASAEFKDGMLEIRIPKANPEQPKSVKIPVSARGR